VVFAAAILYTKNPGVEGGERVKCSENYTFEMLMGKRTENISWKSRSKNLIGCTLRFLSLDMAFYAEILKK
jgi:hypothetical protein